MARDVFAYIGEPDQLMSVREARLLGGRQDGVRMIQLDNGGALECTILPGRAMDLYQVRYKGGQPELHCTVWHCSAGLLRRPWNGMVA